MKREKSQTKYNYARPYVEDGVVYWQPCYLDMETGETVVVKQLYTDKRKAGVRSAQMLGLYKGPPRKVDYQKLIDRYLELKTLKRQCRQPMYIADLVAKEFNISIPSVYRIVGGLTNA
jgi:DNA invertase Pin-like site-specific DNA recombinase